MSILRPMRLAKLWLLLAIILTQGWASWWEQKISCAVALDVSELVSRWDTIILSFTSLGKVCLDNLYVRIYLQDSRGSGAVISCVAGVLLIFKSQACCGEHSYSFIGAVQYRILVWGLVFHEIRLDTNKIVSFSSSSSSAIRFRITNRPCTMLLQRYKRAW